MSRDGSVILDWAGEPRFFRLGWGQIFRLQEACDCGPYLLADRLCGDGWRCEDIAATVLQGLIGGGMAVAQAVGMVRREVLARPPEASLLVARIVILAAINGPSDERIDFLASPQKDPPPEELPNGKIRAANLYGNGAAMGFSPDQVDRASIWQMTAAQAGFDRTNTPDADKQLSSAEMDLLWQGVQARERRH